MFRPFDQIKDSYIADTSGVTTIYHGFYAPGGTYNGVSAGSIDTSKAQFKIAKETRDGSGNTTSMVWATPTTMTTPGVAQYDQIWNNRASLNYV